MRKLLSILLTLSLIIGIFPPIAKADESMRQSMNQYVDEEYGYENFFPETVNGKSFNIVEVDTMLDTSGNPEHTFELGYELKMPNYGEPWRPTKKDACTHVTSISLNSCTPHKRSLTSLYLPPAWPNIPL
jgi:hypothetical protein